MNAQGLFLLLARAIKPLPNVRGKVRLLLLLYRALGLEKRHVLVETTLRRPVGYRPRLDLHSKHERMALCMDGYEHDTVRFLHRLFAFPGYLLDVGANIGLISIPFVQLLRNGRGPTELEAAGPAVYCLEPVRSNHEALTHNISLNHCEPLIKALCVGVGAHEKVAHIQVEGNLAEGGGTGTANILADSSTYKCERIVLRVFTIDTLIRSGELRSNCSLVKIDTDGYDLFALMGARMLLGQARPPIFGEFMAHCLRWHGQTVSDVAEFADSIDYRVFTRRHPGWHFQPLSNPKSFVQDLLLLPEEKLERFSWCLA